MTDAQTPQQRRDEQILAVIRSLREGEVVTYGDIAADAGFPKQSRLVGRLLATVDDDLPWWRVVNSTGRLVPGHEREQVALLLAEDVRCRNGRVQHARFGRFSQPTADLKRRAVKDPATSPARDRPSRPRRPP